MVLINSSRLLNDLRTLREIGGVSTGVVRPAFSDKDIEAREWIKTQFENAGLKSSMDGVGNVFGRSKNEGPALLIGSHSDTQPEGGWLDGALGVVYGLEIVRAFREDPSTQKLAVDAVSWQDEEGNFLSCLGSRSWCGVLDPNIEKTCMGRDGEFLHAALKRVGLDKTARLQIEDGRYEGYLEAHIEQGNYLEDAGEKIGIVSAIVGIRGFTVVFTGEQNHAGTTTMARRRDAATALFDMASRINQQFPSVANDRTVWTIGNVVIEPGAASIIPGRAELTLQFRDQDEEILDHLENIIGFIATDINAKGIVKVEIEPARAPIIPSKMSSKFRIEMQKSAELIVPNKWRHMPSAAGHDPMVINAKLPCGMLFIPSINGVSHNFQEDSHDDDIILGCQVLADAAASILKQA
jgi:N-carbamoyl-L-amino-acid hydrolase